MRQEKITMERTDKVLILTPVKDACRFLDGYFQGLMRLASLTPPLSRSSRER